MATSPSATTPAGATPPPTDPVAEERLQRTLARAGFGSRRACEELIRAGRVTVNGRVATLGDKADPERDAVTVDGSTVNLDPEARYLAVNKPVGVVTSMADDRGRPDLRSLVPTEPRGAPPRAGTQPASPASRRRSRPSSPASTAACTSSATPGAAC